MKKIKLILCLGLIAVILNACVQSEVTMVNEPYLSENENTSETDDKTPSPEVVLTEAEKAEILANEKAAEAAELAKIEAEKKEAEAKAAEALIDRYKTFNVNEMGQLMVVMYHNLSDKPGTYASTPDLFRADLERLYQSGYRPVNLSEVINNTIDIPLGTTPVVLTFDDGYKSDISYDETGEIHKDSVAGIMKAMSEKYDDFESKGIFYIYGYNPFREKDLITKKLNDLIDLGFEIGNHTEDHDELNKLSIEGIQKSLGRQNNFIKKHLPNYDVVHMCYPRGLKPNEDKVMYVFDGIYEEETYAHISAVNVGWNPIVPYGHLKFNPKSINRITCGDDDFELQYWLDYFDNHPEKRYISDGDPETLVIPNTQIDLVDTSIIDQIIIYEKEEDLE